MLKQCIQIHMVVLNLKEKFRNNSQRSNLSNIMIIVWNSNAYSTEIWFGLFEQIVSKNQHINKSKMENRTVQSNFKREQTKESNGITIFKEKITILDNSQENSRLEAI